MAATLGRNRASSRRPFAVSVREARVATRERQAVRVADRRADRDPHGDVEVLDELPDHGDLLGVLLAKVRDVRRDHVEQLRDHRRDAVEVAAAAVSSFERVGQTGDRDRGRKSRRVDILRCGREQVVDVLLGRKVDVA